MIIERIYIGGWFQRTTLHLTEIYDFLTTGRSELALSPGFLEKVRLPLGLISVRRRNWLLEYLEVKTKAEIDLRIYEDGLVALSLMPKDSLDECFESLARYYEKILSPAISYLFSLGAPVPKELAGIKTLLPFIVVVKRASEDEVQSFFNKYDLTAYSEIGDKNLRVYKSSRLILIVSALAPEKIQQLVEQQIFFREFKSQLHHYLNVHRKIWEEIAAIRERGKVSGLEVGPLRARLGDYQKTVGLISSRINQMGSYLHTRAKVSTTLELDRLLDQVFEYKFETLEDTWNYIRELWKMTSDYLSSAVAEFVELQAESTKTSISSLQLITTLGVVAAILGYLGRNSLPTITSEGIVFFVCLVGATWLLNRAITEFFRRKSYPLRKEVTSKLRHLPPA